MMNYKTPNALLKLQFLSKHRAEIKAEYLRHRPKQGYVFIRVDEDYHAVEKPRFIARGFNEDDFRDFLNHGIANQSLAFAEDGWIYYEVHWDDERTSYYLKERY